MARQTTRASTKTSRLWLRPVGIAIALFAVQLAPAVAAPPPNPLPWMRTYITETDLTAQQYHDELVAACGDDLERGVRDNGATGGPRIAVLGDSVQVQTRAPALADHAYRWTYATHCGERFSSALNSGRVADAVATNPDVLLIALGGNSFTENWQTRPDMLGPALADLQRLLDATESVPCRVIYDLPYVAPWFAGNEGDTWLYLTRELNKAIWASQQRRNVHVAGWRDRVAWYWPAYLHDGLHLTRTGINTKLNLAVETARQCQPPDSPPNIATAAGNGTATVWWDTLPAPEQVTSYVVTASDGRSMTTTHPTVNFPGLTNGVAYQFRVAAVNASGIGPPTGWSPPVVPTAAGARFHPMAPWRVLDTRTGTGGKSSPFGPGETYRLSMPAGAVPAGASAAVLNVTATGQDTPTFVTVWPGGQARPLSSNINPSPGVSAIPAMVTTRLAPDGSIQLFNNSGQLHLVADLIGWYQDAAEPSGALYAPVTPQRVLDTRDGTGGKAGPFGGAESYSLALGAEAHTSALGPESGPSALGPEPASSVPADASAVVLNVTATNTTASSHLTIWPDDQPRPLASSLNPQPGLTRANLTVAQLGPAGTVQIYNHTGSTDVVVDVVGYYTAQGAPTGGSEYFALTPERAFDTRDGTGGVTGPITSSTDLSLSFAGRGALPAAGLAAVDANLTVVGSTTDGHTTVWPVGIRPIASVVNYRSGEVIANRDHITLAGGHALAWSTSPAIHYVVDVTGWFGPSR